MLFETGGETEMSISYLRQIEKLQADVANLKQASEAALELVDIVTAERDALQAQVEVLRQAIKETMSCATAEQAKAAFKQLDKAFESTPAACLAHVRADAGRAGFVAGCIYAGAGDSKADNNREASEYAERILKDAQ